MMNEIEKRDHAMKYNFEAEVITKIENYVNAGHKREAVLQYPDIRPLISEVFCNYHNTRAHFLNTGNTEEVKAAYESEEKFNDIIHGRTKQTPDISNIMKILEDAGQAVTK